MAEVSTDKYVLAWDSPQPGTAGCGPVNGQAVEKFRNRPGVQLSLEDLQNLFEDFIGTTSNVTNRGRLQRSMPLAHPIWQNWYASNVTNLRGIGQVQAMDTAGIDRLPFTPRCYDKYALYPDYEFDVTFSTRNYETFTDYAINSNSATYFSKDDVQRSFIYANEYYRYTMFKFAPLDNSLTARAGMMKFIAAGLPVDNTQFSAMPRTFLPDGLLKVIWSGVPLRYATSYRSYLNLFKGYVNQNSFPPDAAKGSEMFLPGELLYLGCTFEQTRRMPSATLNNSTLSPYLGNARFRTWALLCDIEMNFLFTRRPYPNPGEIPPTAVPYNAYQPNYTGNRNILAAGHNLAVALSQDQNFHMALTANAGQPPVGMWYSAPLELLFTDPDYIQGDGTLGGAGLPGCIGPDGRFIL